MTGISAVRVAIARPYALGIPGRARHDARVSGTADMQFRTIAVIPGPSSHDRKSTANAVGPCGPPGFKSPILRCDQQFRPGARSGGTAGFRFPGPLRGHRRNPAARLPHRYPPPRGPCHARNPGRLAPVTNRPAVMFADGSPRARVIRSGQRRPSGRGGAIRDQPRQRIRVCGCAGSCLMCSRSTVAGQDHSQRGLTATPRTGASVPSPHRSCPARSRPAGP